MTTASALPAWDESKGEFLDRVTAARGVLKIGLKTKNDAFFLERWITHHARIVGFENLVIIDNMSSDERVLEVYRAYQSRAPIVRFAGYYDSLHSGSAVPELYQSLTESCDYFLLLDTDEFLVHIAGDTYSRDARMLDVLRREPCDAFPGTWLENVKGCENRFQIGTLARSYFGLLAWGKPIRRTSAHGFGRGGFVNHNVDVDKSLYRVLAPPQFFVLHMRHLDVQQRINANLNHLIARGIVSAEETLESILGRDLGVAGVPHMESIVKELRSLATTATTPFPGSYAPDSWLELTSDGRVVYSGPRQAEAMQTFLTKSELLCRTVLETDGEQLRSQGNMQWKRWRQVLDQHDGATQSAGAGTSTPAAGDKTSRARARRAQPHAGARQSPVCIAGAFHSGASLVARVLNATGLYFGDPSDLRGSPARDVDDACEHSRFVAVNDQVLNAIGGGWDRPVRFPATWKTDPHLAPLTDTAHRLLSGFNEHAPWGWTDPRNSLTLPFWQAAFGPLKVVVCVRHPLDVVVELVARHGLSNSLALHLWTTYNEQILRDSRPADRLVTHDEAFVTDPENEVARLLSFCGLDVSGSSSDARTAIIEGHRRHAPSTNADLAAAELAPDVLDLYGQLLREAGRPHDAAAVAEIAKAPGARKPRARHSTPADNARGMNPFVVDVLNERHALKAALAAKDRALAAKDAAIGVREATYLEMLTEINELRSELTRTKVEAEEHEAVLDYEQLRGRLHDALDDAIPVGATVLMVSLGDDTFLRLPGRQVSHFPRTEDGTWNGNPGTSQDAIDQLDAIRATTSAYLVFPAPAFWWLEHYADLTAYLQTRGESVGNYLRTAAIFKLDRTTT